MQINIIYWSGTGNTKSMAELIQEGAQKAGATEAQTHAYIYEFPSSTQTGIGSVSTGGAGATVSNNIFAINRQYLILEKNNSSLSKANTFYRLDFYNDKSEVFFDTKRNHHYMFTINKVRSEGYTTLAQAHNNAGGNIEYTVVISDGSRHITSNGQYALVTNVDSVIIYTANMGQFTNIGSPLSIRYEDPKVVLDPATRLAFSVSSENTFPASTTISAIAPTSITPANQEVRVTIGNNFERGYLVFTLGNITHKVHVTRRMP